jgi:hypothetical protein
MVKCYDFRDGGVQVCITLDADDFFFLRDLDIRGTEDTGIIDHIVEQVENKIKERKRKNEN